MATSSSPHATVASTATESFRKLFISNEEENDRLRRECKYAENCISTSKYTVIKYVSG